MNSADNVAAVSEFTVKSFSLLPVSFPINILGILIPVPVPSSPMIIFVIFSSLSSITTTREAPARSAFLTLVTNEQFPRSKRTIFVANASYANWNSAAPPTASKLASAAFWELVCNVILWHPSMFFLSK